MTQTEILYLIAALNGAALIAVIAGVIELCSWGYIHHQKKH